MAFANRWDWLLDKAVKASGQHPARLCLGWPHIISEAHRNRHLSSAEETQHLAEVQWWSQLFPGQPFPEGWKPEGDAGDKNDAVSGPAPKIDLEKVVYKSCWIALKEKALREGITWETLVENYKGRLLYSVDSYIKFGPAVVQFRSELLTWRDLFPDEVFVGIDPQTGVQNLRTSKIVREDNAAEEAKKAMQPAGGDEEMPEVPEVQVEKEVASNSFFPNQDDLSHLENGSENRPNDPRFHFLGGAQVTSDQGSRRTSKHEEPAWRQKPQSSKQETQEEERSRQEFRRQRDSAYVAKGHDLLDDGRRDSTTKRDSSAHLPGQRSQQSSPARPKSSRDLFDDEAPRHRHEQDATDSPRGRPRATHERSGRDVRREETPGGTLRGRSDYYRHRSRSPKERVYSGRRRERSPLRERDERSYSARKQGYADSRASRNKHRDERCDERVDGRHEKRRHESVDHHHREKRRNERVDDRREKHRDEPKRRDESPVRSVVLLDDRDIDNVYKESRRRGKRGGGGRRRFEHQDLGAELRSYGRKKDSKEARDRRR